MRDPLDVAIDGHQRLAEREQQEDRGGLLADAVDGGEPVPRLERGQIREELQRVIAALPADVGEGRLDPGRLLVGQPTRPDDVDQLGERGVLHGIPVRCGAVRQPISAPAGAGVVGTDRVPGRVRLTQRLEGDLGVRVGAVLGEDREDQLTRRVQAALPDGMAVQTGQLVHHERDETRAEALQGLRPGPARVREVALLRPGALRFRARWPGRGSGSGRGRHQIVSTS